MERGTKSQESPYEAEALIDELQKKHCEFRA